MTGRDKIVELIKHHQAEGREPDPKRSRYDQVAFELLLPRHCICIHTQAAQRMPDLETASDIRNDWPFNLQGCEECQTFCFGDLIDFFVFRRDCEGWFRLMESFEENIYCNSISMVSRLLCYSARQHDWSYYPSNLRFAGFDLLIQVITQ